MELLKALHKTYTADAPRESQELPFDLAGSWFPVRHDEWYNRLPGKHSQRARSRSTKMTYNSHGKGSGWVGEVYVDVQVRTIAPGRYTSKFQVRASTKTLPFFADDGHMTLLEDGTLQVQYPSHGIREYWGRADGRGAQILQRALEQRLPRTHEQSRSIKLVFRRFGHSTMPSFGLLWHWGLSIDHSIYEVNGAMAVMGPNGIVAASTPFLKPLHTNLQQFHGYLDLPQITTKTDEEIEQFSCRWVKQHPMYKVLGPNCQTYTDDLFRFLTGEDLPFAKAADKMVGPGGEVVSGPEVDPSAVWLDPSKKQ